MASPEVLEADRSHASGPPSSRERMGEPHAGERRDSDVSAGRSEAGKRSVAARTARSEGEESIVPTNRFNTQYADACRIRMCRVNEGIAFDVEDDTGHEQNRGLGEFEPCVASLAADLQVFVSPADEVLLIQSSQAQVVGEFEGDADLMFGDLASRVYQLFEHGACVSDAGIDNGAAGGVPSGAVDARTFPAFRIETRVCDSIKAHDKLRRKSNLN